MKRKIALLLTAAAVLGGAGNVFASDDITVLLNGEKMVFDAEPYIENGTTRVPMRAIFEALGAEVDWDSEEKTVTAKKDGTEIKLTIGSETALLNGSESKLLVPAEIKENRTMVPLRFVSESLGANVGWDAETKTVIITDETEEEVIVSAPKAEEYKSKDGWSVKYDASAVQVNETQTGASFVFTGEGAGTNLIEIGFEKDKQPMEVLTEMIEGWDDENTERREFIYNDRLMFSANTKTEKTGSGLVEGVIASEYNGGVIYVDYVMHLSGNEEEDITVNDILLSIFESMEFTKSTEQKMYDYVPGTYERHYTEEIEGKEVEIVNTITLNKGYTGTISMQDDVDIYWYSNVLSDDSGTNAYEYTIEGDNLYLNVDGEWQLYEKVDENAGTDKKEGKKAK